jgi:hypothetical protein
MLPPVNMPFVMGNFPMQSPLHRAATSGNIPVKPRAASADSTPAPRGANVSQNPLAVSGGTMTKWIIYVTNDGGACTIEKGAIQVGQDAELIAKWRGGRLLGIQPNERKAESFRRLIELQAQLQGYPVLDS